MNDPIADYERAIAADPQALANYWQLGLLHLLRGDAAEAQSIWWAGMMAAEAAAIETGITDLLHLLKAEAIRQLQANRPDLVEILCQQALELQAQAEIYFYWGEAVSLQGRLEEAIELWQQAIQLDPSWAEPYQQQGKIWQKLGQYENAIAAYQQAVALQPDYQTHYNLGLCLAHMRQWQAAILQFQRAIQLEPDLPAAYADLGWAWLWLKQPQTAYHHFHTALQEQTHFAATYCDWVIALQSVGRADFKQELNAALLSTIRDIASAPAFSQAFNQLIQQKPQSSSAQLTNSQITDSQPEPLADEPLEPVLTPTGFYETTQAWAATQQQSSSYIPLDAASTVLLTPPRSLDPEVHYSFRFGREVSLPGTFVASIPQGRVWSAIAQSSIAIFANDNHLLGDLSAEFPLLSPGHPESHPSQHSALHRQLPSLEHIKGTVAVLSGLTDDMYFHWMFDVLPRIDLLQRSGIDLATIDYFLVNHHLPFQTQTLEAFGIAANQILPAKFPLHLQATNLIAPSFPGSPAWMPRWACDFLRQTFLGANPPSGNLRLYISRQNTANRRLINEVDLLPILDKFGFQSVTLEALSVSEQASLLSQAAVVLSPHGSGLTNIVFCQPGTKIIELFAPEYVYPCYWLLSNLMQLEYYYLIGTSPAGFYLRQLLYPNPRLEDIWLDQAQFSQLLELAINE